MPKGIALLVALVSELAIALLACSLANAQFQSDPYKSEAVEAALAQARKCLGKSEQNKRTVELLLDVLEFRPEYRNRFILPSKPNTSKVNGEALAKSFKSKELLAEFQQSIDQIANELLGTAAQAESNQAWETGYRLRWQSAGLHAMLPAINVRGQKPKPWSHSAAIGVTGRLSKSFSNHPKTSWPAGSYSMVTTHNFEIASQAGTESTEEIAELCEQSFGVWKQLFFSYWCDKQPTAPEYATRRNQKFSVAVFRNKAAYDQALRSLERNIGISTGFYDPNQKIALFYWDGNKTASTIVHELTHQFFYEASVVPVELDTDNGPGFWIVEGIALYLESMSSKKCGGCVIADIGGWDSLRLQRARYRRLHDEFWIPWDNFRAATGKQFRSGEQIGEKYSQATGLAHLWMDGPWNPKDRDRKKELTDYIASIYAGQEDPNLLGHITDDELRTVYDTYLTSSPLSNFSRPFFTSRTDAVLSRCPISSEQLLAWPTGFRDSSWLDLSFTTVGDDLFVDSQTRLARDWNVSRLNLESTQVTDGSMLAIAKMKNLVDLDLSNCKITDQGVALLVDNKSIKTLWLTQCNITDKTIETLLTLTQLDFVHLKGTQVSPEAWEQLLRDRPRLKSKSIGP